MKKSSLTVMLGFILLFVVAIMCWPKLESEPEKSKAKSTAFVPIKTRTSQRVIAEKKDKPITITFGIRANFDQASK